MPRVMGIEYSPQILGIPPWSADIFRRTTALGRDKARKRFPRLGCKAPLYFDGVPPIVA